MVLKLHVKDNDKVSREISYFLGILIQMLYSLDQWDC